MPLKVLSASAGSGKTYNLAMFYTKLAMENVDNYKKIIAITFTNAAVNEMKNRILQQLFDLSKGDGINDYRAYADIGDNITNSEIAQRADEVLNRIIHQYYNFSVSTIDSFLQRLFKGALYEIGVRTNYELIVNNEDVIEQAVNDFLLNLDEQQSAFKWLVKFIKNNTQVNKTSNYIKQLIQLTHEINKEFFFPFENQFVSLSEQDFDNLEWILKKNIKIFIEKSKKYQKQFADLCAKSGLSEDDFYQKSKGPAGFLGSKLIRFINDRSSISKFDLTNKYLNEALNNGKWISKNSQTKFKPFKHCFQKLLTDFVSLIKSEGKQYEDSRIILEQLFNISILNLILRNLYEYKKTNNLVLLSDIGKLLQGFIANNYFFIYEKLGVRYEYFLIDEFQDTSNIQYQVLKPMIENSVSEKKDDSVLLVGDIKQAIYRWRNGDWKLMKKTIHKDFTGNIHYHTLDNNWRSYPVIIDSNNAFFKHLVEMTNLYKKEKEDNSSLLILAQNIYKDVEQKFPSKKTLGDFKGYVKLIIHKSNSQHDNVAENIYESENENEDLNWVADEVNRLWNHGYKNIGIIVRRNIEATLIFDYLMNNVKILDDDFKIISKESITFVNSNVAMWVVFTLHYLYNNSQYAQYMAKSFYNKLIVSSDADSFYAGLNRNTDLKAKNIYYKTEYLINNLYSFLNEREKTFSIHFLQLLKKYLDTNPISEAAFIDWFFKKGMSESIKIRDDKKGVHLVTIHKSKGLEYDAVIIPSVNWTKKAAVEYLWLSKPAWLLDNNVPAFLVRSNKSLLSSNFEQEYLQEQNNSKIDDINLLYVAFTRAKKVLIVGVEQKYIGKELITLIDSNFIIEGFNQNINNYKTSENEKNVIYELGEFKNNDEHYIENESKLYDIIPVTKPLSLNLVVKGNDELSSQKNIAYGILIHAIMEQINNIYEWEKIAQKIMTAINIAEQDKINILDRIEKIFQKHSIIKDWYKGSEKIISERKILFNGKIYRPDKIFVHNEIVFLVDFKTGITELEKYKNQLKKYKAILTELKYKNIEAYLLNIDTNELMLVD